MIIENLQYADNLLQNRDICPKCGASWQSLQEDLETEPIAGSPALDQALIVIKNCDLCRIKFKKQLAVIEKVYTARRLNKQGVEVGRV